MRYTAVEEGEVTAQRSAVVPEDMDRTRVRFMQGDACNLPKELGPVDAGAPPCQPPEPPPHLLALACLVHPRCVPAPALPC